MASIKFDCQTGRLVTSGLGAQKADSLIKLKQLNPKEQKSTEWSDNLSILPFGNHIKKFGSNFYQGFSVLSKSNINNASVLLNKHGHSPFLFQNCSSRMIDIQ